MKETKMRNKYLKKNCHFMKYTSIMHRDRDGDHYTSYSSYIIMPKKKGLMIVENISLLTKWVMVEEE